MFKWIVLVICILATAEALSQIWYNLYLDMVNANLLIKARIEKITEKIKNVSEQIEQGVFNPQNLTTQLIIPTIIQMRYMRFLEGQNKLHWRTQAAWTLKLFTLTTWQRGIYLRLLMREYGKINLV